MTSRVDGLIEELSKIHPKGFDLSLERISKLLQKLGNPHLNLPPVIHVAGTNGKGSTLAFCRAILESSGHKVHVHTSPHLVNWHERYRLAGDLVSDDKLAEAIEKVAKANDNQPITVFELLSAVMFVLFSENPADYALVEVGLGGRFDATNVLQNPIVTAITPVALDHQSYLGDTIEKIAFEKAGIIKQDVPVVISHQEDEAREVIEQVATRKKAPIEIAGQDFDAYKDGTGFVYQDGEGLINLPLPRLLGEHQISNAALAIAAIKAAGIEIDAADLARAMKDVIWPGRFERLAPGAITNQLGRESDIWIDGGHNPQAGNAISNALIELDKGALSKTVLICGMINTKEPLGFFQPFNRLDVEVLCVPVEMSEAGIAPQELAKVAAEAGLKASACDSLDEGIELAAQRIKKELQTRVLFCGSLYMVGEVLDKNGTHPK